MSAAPTIYIIDSVTREIIGTGFADIDPLDDDNWLIPGFSFTDAPPKNKAGMAVVRTADGVSWEYQEDRRGTIVYKKTNGDSEQHSALGPIPAEYTDKPWPGEFYVWQRDDWEIDSEAEAIAAIVRASDERDRRLTVAAIRIAPLQDAVDRGKATPAKIALLDKWKDYRIDVGDISEQEGYPKSINWPVEPS